MGRSTVPLRQILSLFAWRSGAQRDFEIKDARAAFGRDRFAGVLEFERLRA
jgi:hypothetical protein